MRVSAKAPPIFTRIVGNAIGVILAAAMVAMAVAGLIVAVKLLVMAILF